MEGLVVLQVAAEREREREFQGSCRAINSQSSVTFRDKHYYNIYDSFSEAAMCGKVR